MSRVMAQELTLIANRRREVEQDIARLRQEMAARETEMTELEMAERVIARLTGANVTSEGVGRATTMAPIPGEGAKGKRTLPEMIKTIMQDKLSEGIDGIEPKEATPIIRERWQPDISGTYVSTTFWRMMKGGLLDKLEGTSIYRLPKKKETADSTPTKDWSTASLFETPAKGREAGPGGGT